MKHPSIFQNIVHRFSFAFGQRLFRSVVVVGYPKSGNTWLTRMVADVAGAEVAGFWNQPGNNEIAKTVTGRWSKYRVYKAHQIPKLLNKPILPYRVIYVVRDPRDVCCSGANFFPLERYLARHEVTIDKYEAMTRTIEDGSSAYPHCKLPWHQHVESYSRKNVCFVRYEDLISEPVAELSRIARYIGVRSDDSRLAQIAQRHSFKNMNDRANAGDGGIKPGFFRKGIIGAYKEELTRGQISRIEHSAKEMMNKFGYI